jgi:biofilm PGA synthesis N-glycosyltransferase PgaC
MEEAEEVNVRSRIEPGAEAAEEPDAERPGLVLAVVVAFLNEARHLPTFLASVDAQTRPPDRLLLVDDGSTDSSYALAEAFAAEHAYARVIRRPPRPPEADRLSTAAELKAFQWGLEQVDVPYDIVSKMDADLELRPGHFEEVLARLENDPGLGLAGAYLSIRLPDGSTAREEHPVDDVRGPNKFYRRECLEQISPLPAHLGWDTIDEVKARMHGWRTMSIALPGGDSLHLRPVGTHDGRLRAFWRWGECAYGYGSHPLHILAAGAVRCCRRPYGAAGAAYVLGWANASLRHRPRADADVRAFRRREELGTS